MTQSICRCANARRVSVAAAAFLATALLSTAASAQALGYASDSPGFWTDGGASQPSLSQPSITDNNDSDAYVLPQRLQRQIVSYGTSEAPGTVIIDTPNTVLYYVLGNNRASLSKMPTVNWLILA